MQRWLFFLCIHKTTYYKENYSICSLGFQYGGGKDFEIEPRALLFTVSGDASQ